jgi:hypothetical protein
MANDLMAGRNQLGKELATLDFANLIGGPLNAVVEAQAKAAITTVNFIKEVAFDKEGQARQVSFTYTRSEADGTAREYKLSVPFLTMLPIPYIAVKKATIDFNAKITSTVSSDSSDSLKTDTNADASTGFWFVKAKVNTKVAYQKTNSSSGKEERTYDLHINVEATNEEMPAGTERLLTILEQSISETKGPEVFILKFTLGTDGKTATLLEDLPAGAASGLGQNPTFTLAAVSTDGKPIDPIPFTVTANPADKTLTFTTTGGKTGKLAPTVTSITVKAKQGGNTSTQSEPTPTKQSA